jgi:hypothetical protein
LLFPLRIEVRDALFGFPIGSAVQLTLPDHSRRLVPLGADHGVTLTGLPRANYQIVAKGFGFGLSAPTALSKPQVAKVLLLSWADLAVVLAFAVLFVVGLPLIGGRVVRRSRGVRLPVWRGGKPAEAPPAESPDPVTDPAAQAPETTAQTSEPAEQAETSEPAEQAEALAGARTDQATVADVESPTTADETAPTKNAASGAAQRGAEPEDPDSTIVLPAITDVTDAPAGDQRLAGENNKPTTESAGIAARTSPTDERRES